MKYGERDFARVLKDGKKTIECFGGDREPTHEPIKIQLHPTVRFLAWRGICPKCKAMWISFPKS